MQCIDINDSNENPLQHMPLTSDNNIFNSDSKGRLQIYSELFLSLSKKIISSITLQGRCKLLLLNLLH